MGTPKAGTRGTGRFWTFCISKTPGNSCLGFQSVGAEEHHAQRELARRDGQGKRRLQSTSSAKVTLLFFPPFSFDIKQAECTKGRCRHN